ncbi:DUF6415 family natural product biosynthesis protein [Streptomyces sp. NPDC058534]|uniref:DUF6415 family natural product biosynthesis protein n=1 Tax=Streptomyces sp. NPDC058534 TaxID=3346541 RepID=UPI0036560D4A
MKQATAPKAMAEEQQTAPPDLATMRETAELLLGPDGSPDVLPPVGDELAAHTATLRGQLELLIPELENVVTRLPRESIPRYCALACIGEARGKLRAEPSRRYGGDAGYARRLARVLRALCDHYQNITAWGPAPRGARALEYTQTEAQ